ncbi:MAG TPA: aldo/keto reductase [Candidatus Acidoferrales bacterium]|nr:aldo/keto reductase [Candidatus Acidoferrales bacterium]
MVAILLQKMSRALWSNRTSAPLGYGTASLMGRSVRRLESLRLLETAHDHGITHFDTARSYGFGEAEAVVGEFARGRRAQITIATKLGILPPNRTFMAVAKALARPAVRMVPALRSRMRRAAGAMQRSGAFDVAAAQASLEKSLRALKTDYVDLLLLHECRPHDLESDELFAFLEGAVAAGRVLAYGIATDPESTHAILAQHPRYAPIVQSPYEPLPAAYPGVSAPVTIVHSVFRSATALWDRLKNDPPLASKVADLINVPSLDRETLCTLFLQNAAARARAGGMVLFSSVTSQRIRANVAVLSSQRFSLDQFDHLIRITQSAVSSSAAS